MWINSKKIIEKNNIIKKELEPLNKELLKISDELKIKTEIFVNIKKIFNEYNKMENQLIKLIYTLLSI